MIFFGANGRRNWAGQKSPTSRTSCSYMYLFVYTKYVPGAYRIQERGSDSLEFKLGVVVSHFVGAQNHTVSSKRVMSALNH